MNIKTFEDLQFTPRHSDTDDQVTTLEFSNDYGVSVITGESYYTSEKAPYELAVLYKGELTYLEDICDGDVCGWLTDEDVTELMHKVQHL